MTLPINNAQITHTTAEWQSLNPTLATDVIGIEVMSNGYNRYKRGDGVTRWLGLAYIDKVYRQDIPVDAIPTDGSGNPVSSNGVYNALAGKQDKITNTANRLFYGSGTSGTLSQLALPSVAGSVLRQDTSGAPYWSTDLQKRNSLIVASASSNESFAAGDNHIVTFNSVLQENDPLNILSVSNNNIVCSQAATVLIGASIDLASNGITSGAIADGHLMLRINNVSSAYYQRFLCAGGHDNMLNMFPIVLTLSAGDAIGVELYNPFTCTLGSGTTKRFWVMILN